MLCDSVIKCFSGHTLEHSGFNKTEECMNKKKISLEISAHNEGFSFQINSNNHQMLEQDFNDCYGIARVFIQLAQDNPKLVFDSGEKAMKKDARFTDEPFTTSTVN